jgi:hypothetical protein
MEHSCHSEVNSSSSGQEMTCCLENRIFITILPSHRTGNYPEPDKAQSHLYIMCSLMLMLCVTRNGHLFTAFQISPMYATCPAHLEFVVFIVTAREMCVYIKLTQTHVTRGDGP